MKSELLTDRLRLRPLTRQDADWVAALERDPEVMRHIPFSVPDSDLLLDDPSLGYWAIENRSGGAPYGWVALKTLYGTREIEIGYRLWPAAWCNGIATEAARRLLRYGFDVAGMERIVAVTTRSNAASQRVIEKLGMPLEKVLVFDGVEWLNYALSYLPPAVAV